MWLLSGSTISSASGRWFFISSECASGVMGSFSPQMSSTGLERKRLQRGSGVAVEGAQVAGDGLGGGLGVHPLDVDTSAGLGRSEPNP